MQEIKQTVYEGTRILLGNKKRELINKMIEILKKNGFEEISIPVIQYQKLFKGKVGEENNNMMFNFKDRGDRDLCLAPEYTAVVQELASTYFKPYKDVKLFYVQETFRGEKPQKGRWRQFTQLGVEILNPSKDYLQELILLSRVLLDILPNETLQDLKLDENVTRGLDYYKEGKGFEVRINDTQILGGGEYNGGIGFAIGIDRLI